MSSLISLVSFSNFLHKLFEGVLICLKSGNPPTHFEDTCENGQQRRNAYGSVEPVRHCGGIPFQGSGWNWEDILKPWSHLYVLAFWHNQKFGRRRKRLTLHKTIVFPGSIGVRRRFRARPRSLRAPWMTERIGPASRRCGNALGRLEPLERFVVIVEQLNHAPDPLRSGLVPLNRAMEGQVGQSISPINIGRWSHGPHLPAGLTNRRAVILKAIDVPESHASVST